MSDASTDIHTRIIGPLFKSKAEELFEQGQIALALEAFRQQAEHQESFYRVHLGIGKCLMAMGQPGQALVPLEKARRLAPDDAETLTTLAAAHVSMGSFQEAVGLLEPLSASATASARAYFLLGVCFENLGEHGDAAQAYGHTLQIDPSHQEAARRLGEVLERIIQSAGGDPRGATIVQQMDVGVLRKDQRTLALGLLTRTPELSSTRAEDPLLAGEHLGEESQFTRVIDGYGKALQEKPDYEDVWAGLAMAHAAKGDYKLALQHVMRAIAIRADRTDFQMLRGDMLMHLSDFAQALEAYQAVLGRDSEDAEAHFCAGNAAFLLGHEDEALEHYYKAVGRNSLYSLAFLNIACIHERRRAYKEAKRSLGRFADLAPEDPRIVVRQSGLLISQGLGAEAIDVCLGAISRWGEGHDLCLNLGAAQLTMGDLEAAEGTLTRVINEWPASSGAWVDLGLIALRREQIDHARLMLEKALQLDADCAEAHHNQGVLLHREGRHEEAAAAFERASRSDAGMREPYYLRAQCLMELQRHPDAVPVLRRLLAIDHGYQPAYQMLGQALEKTGELGKALDAYKDLAQQTPDYAGTQELIMSMWSVHRLRGDTPRALKALEGALLLDTTSMTTRLALGVTYHEAGQDALARKAYDKVIAMDPAMARAHLALGVLLFDVDGDTETGIAKAQKAIELEPGLASAYFDVGIMQGQIGQEADAADALERALDLEPDFAEAAIALALLRPGPDGGLALLERATYYAPRSFTAWTNLGVVRHERGDLDGAVEALERAARIDASGPLIHFDLGVVFHDRGEITAASQAYTRSLDIEADPDTYLNIGLLAQASRQPHLARTMLQKGLTRFPAHAPLKVALASCLVEEGVLDLALSILEEAFRQAPDDPTCCLNFVVLLAGRGDLARARTVLDTGLSKERWPELVEALGIVLMRSGQHEDALAALTEAAGALPGRLETTLALGIALLGAGRIPEALACAHEVVSGDPSLMAGRLLYGVSMRAAGHWDEELAEYEAAATCDPEHPGPAIDKALVLRERGDLEGALATLAPMLERWPHESRLHRLAGELCYRLGRLEDAAARFGQALAANERDASLRTNTALVLHKLGRSEEALGVLSLATQATFVPLHLLTAEVCRTLDVPGEVDALERALLLDEGCAQARIAAASRAIELGQPSRALTLLDHPSVDGLAATSVLLGLAREASDDLKGALNAYDDAVRAGEPACWLNIGLIERALGRFRQEMTAYRRALAAGVPESDVQPLIAQARLLHGQPRHALAALEQVAGTLDADGKALLGTLRLVLGSPGTGGPLLEEACAALPDDQDLSYNLTLAYLLTDNAEMALGQAGRRSALEPSDHFIQGLALELTGDVAGAAACYRSGLDHFPEALALGVALLNLKASRPDGGERAQAASELVTLIEAWGESAPSFLHANLRRLVAGTLPPGAWLGRLPSDLSRAARAARARPCLSNRELPRRLPDALGPRFPSRWFVAIPRATRHAPSGAGAATAPRT